MSITSTNSQTVDEVTSGVLRPVTSIVSARLRVFFVAEQIDEHLASPLNGLGKVRVKVAKRCIHFSVPSSRVDKAGSARRRTLRIFPRGISRLQLQHACTSNGQKRCQNL